MAPALPKSYPPPGPLGQTNPYDWRLDSSDHGRHVWYYLGEGGGKCPQVAPKGKEREQSVEDKYWLGLPTGLPPLPLANGDPMVAARRGYEFYKQLQAPDGHWSGEYSGPHFLLPAVVFSAYITQTPLPQEWKIELSRYLMNTRRKNGVDDNGWGIHTEGRSTVFGTACSYVILRILGVDKDHPDMVKARNTLLALGGAEAIPSWGKFFLAILNLYNWQGFNPVPPELFVLPDWVPVHPWRWWPHTRAVYLPMSYLYGIQYQMPLNDLLQSIRQEIFTQPYESITWVQCRNLCANADLYVPHTKIVDGLFSVLSIWQNYCPQFIRDAGLRRVYNLIVMEDDNTSCQGIAPVSGPLQGICRWIVEGPESKAVKLHQIKLRDVLWMCDRGLVCTGTNGSQLWDTAFITQALVETGLAKEKSNNESVLKALEWLDDCQIRENPKHYLTAYRHATKGAWPFSTKEQGYTVSDCTAEGLKSVIMLQDLNFTPKLVTARRLYDAVDVMLSLQNPSGGFASYELIRGSSLLEWLNPAEVFGNIMIEYAYPECTTSVLSALCLFTQHYPAYRAQDIQQCLKKAQKYIHSTQRPDGSWYGSWGICFTYATMFALESLAFMGETYENSARVRRACSFILARQMDDGGWGESYKSSETQVYVHHLNSQVVNTSWAVLTLLHAKCPDRQAIKRGVQLIMTRQLRDGSWAQEAIEGVFNKNVAIGYPNFKFSWTIWAMGKAKMELKGETWEPLADA